MTTAGRDNDRFRAAAAVADEAVRSGTHPAALIAVADRETMRWTHLAPGDERVTLDSIWLLASLTKPIVATALMRLVERGRLLLDTPVAAYLPEFAAAGKERVTTSHLLTHTSGLEGERPEAELSRRAAPAAEYFAAACATELRFEPGSRLEYCSLSFWVLAELITRLSGQPYPRFLETAILAPLEMRDTAFAPRDQHRAVEVQRIHPAAITYLTSLAAPGGGLWSTAGDLVRFGQTMLNGGRTPGYRLIGGAALDMMTRRHTAGLSEAIDGQSRPALYGLGWRKLGGDVERRVLGSARSYGHGGLTGSYLWIDPEWDLVFVFLSNAWGLEHDTARRALNAVYGALDRPRP